MLPHPQMILNGTTYDIMAQVGNLSCLQDAQDAASIYDSTTQQLTPLSRWLRSKAFNRQSLSPNETHLLTAGLAHLRNGDKILRGVQLSLQDLCPQAIPHSSKHFASGVLTLTQPQIAAGRVNGYEFIATPELLQIKFAGTSLGHMTIICPANGYLKVAEVRVHEQFNGLNLARVIMVMLGQQALAHANAQGLQLPIYSVGQDTDVTNKSFWDQYGTNAASLLQRGDFQQIDVAANPLQEANTSL